MMEIESQGKAIEFLLKALPYPEQMKDIDLSYSPAVYFTWRSAKYKVDLQTGRVDVVDGGCLVGEDRSLLITRLLAIESVKDYMKK